MTRDPPADTHDTAPDDESQSGILPIDRRDYLQYTGVLAGGSFLGSPAGATASSETSDAGESGSIIEDDATPTDLRVEYATNPLGVDEPRPRFSWCLASDQPDQGQTAYRIRVGSSAAAITSEGADVWDSGKVASSRSTNIEYDGPALDPATRYYWTVRVWDVDETPSEWSEPAHWETGLLDEENWTAEWIGRSEDDSSSDERPGSEWTDYSFEADVTLLEAAAGLVFRAQDADNLYMWQINTVRSSEPLLRPHIREDGGWSTLEPVSLQDVMGENPHDQHRVRIDVVGDRITTTIDGQQVHRVTDSTHSSGTIGFRQNGAEHARYDDVLVTAEGGDVLFEEHFDSTLVETFSGGSIVDGQLDVQGGGVVLRSSGSRNPSPLLRSEVPLDQNVVDARAYVSGLGFYELYVNGEQIGEQVLDPAQTDYEHTVLYATHDVTDALQRGENALGVALGRGRYGELADNVWNWDDPPWWSDPELRLQVEVTFDDGSTTTITSDDDWYVTDGPTRRDSLFAGEFYDAREEQAGWTTPAYDDADWEAVDVVDGPAGEATAQHVQPITTFERLEPVDVTEPESGVYVFDIGQMIAGWTEIAVDGPEGTAVTLTMGEKLHGDGTVNNDNGLISEPMQTDTYVLDGNGPETWESRFSYKGFRYVQVEGYPGTPTADDITGVVVHSAIDENVDSDFACSSDLLTQIHENTQWAFLNNYHGVPTDTPTYEKNGWTADALVTAETGMFNFRLARFYRKWLADVRDAQLDAPEVIGEEGNIPVIVPTADWGYAGWTPDPAWQSVYVLLTWWTYQYYGDRRILEEHYDGMKAYVRYLQRKADSHIIRDGLGDWVAPGGGAVPPEGPGIVSTAYFYRDAEVLADIAAVLGHDDEATEFSQLATDIETAFNDEFFDPTADVYSTGNVSEYRQTSNVFPLAYDLVPGDHEDAVAANLAENVMEVHDGHLDTGAHGTKYLLPVLTEHGYHDVAYTVATQRTYPSWGHWVENDMTALLERWTLNARSRDHHFLGSIDEWFYKYLAGIRAPDEPGFDRFTVKPHPPEDLDEVTATTETVKGTIESHWLQNDDGTFTHDLSIPVNASADVHVPAEYRWAVIVDGELAVTHDVTAFQGMDEGYAVFEMGSGDWSIESDPMLGRFGFARHLTSEQQETVSDLRDAGDLTADQTEHLNAQLSKLHSQLEEAMTARIAGDATVVERHAQQALVTVNQLRRWLSNQVQSGGLSRSTAAGLQDSLRTIDQAVSTNSERLLDVQTELVNESNAISAGSSGRVTAVVANDGEENINDVSVSLSSPAGWTVTPVGSTKTGVIKPGQSFAVEFEVAVPLSQPTGPVTLTGQATYQHRGGTVESSVSTALTIGSPIDVTSLEADSVQPGETTEVNAVIGNAIDRPVSGTVSLTIPDGWNVDSVEKPYQVDASGTSSVTFDVAVPASATSDGVVTAVATYGDIVGARAQTEVDVDVPSVTVDDFEDDDLAEYKGHVDGYEVDSQTPVLQGESSLKMRASGDERRIASTLGLAHYPSAGDTVKYNFQLGSASDTITFVFGAQSETADPAHRYDLNLHSPSNTMYLWRIENGVPTAVGSTQVPIADYVGKWLEGTIEWGSDGTIVATLTDPSGTRIARLTGTDTTYQRGGIGYRINKAEGSPGVTVDHVRTL